MPERVHHRRRQLVQVDLDLALHGEGRVHADLFPVLGDHHVGRLVRLVALVVLDEAQVGQRVVAVAEVGHDLLRVRPVGQHVQERHRADEVEPGEHLLLAVQVFVQRFLALIQAGLPPRQVQLAAVDGARLDHVGLVDRLAHHLLELAIDGFEDFGDVGELRPDVGAREEDGLERGPRARHAFPQLDHLLHVGERRLPLFHLRPEKLDELAHTQHGLEFEHVRVERLDDLLVEPDERHFRVLVLDVFQHEAAPARADVLELLLDLLLLLRRLHHLLHLLDVLVQVELHHVLQQKLGLRRVHHRGLADARQLRPVPRRQRVRVQVRDQREHDAHVADRRLDVPEDDPALDHRVRRSRGAQSLEQRLVLHLELVRVHRAPLGLLPAGVGILHHCLEIPEVAEETEFRQRLRQLWVL
mmetsp:Transcript_25191/g.84662  ORF Transcript_25191/g.84662 Transcript_25191/m.84662 type:complete len:414 (-) Transcript_25191:3985-5226(-)